MKSEQVSLDAKAIETAIYALPAVIDKRARWFDLGNCASYLAKPENAPHNTCFGMTNKNFAVMLEDLYDAACDASEYYKHHSKQVEHIDAKRKENGQLLQFFTACCDTLFCCARAPVEKKYGQQGDVYDHRCIIQYCVDNVFSLQNDIQALIDKAEVLDHQPIVKYFQHALAVVKSLVTLEEHPDVNAYREGVIRGALHHAAVIKPAVAADRITRGRAYAFSQSVLFVNHPWTLFSPTGDHVERSSLATDAQNRPEASHDVDESCQVSSSSPTYSQS